MSQLLTSIRIRNFRALANLNLPLRPINVFFGPNGVGKSSLLDALAFVRDCLVRDVNEAASLRNQGIGLLNEIAAPDSRIEIQLETQQMSYGIRLGVSSGKISKPEEDLRLLNPETHLLKRTSGAHAECFPDDSRLRKYIDLIEPEKLAIGKFLDMAGGRFPEVIKFWKNLGLIRLYRTHEAAIDRLKTLGSDSSPEAFLFEQGENLWACLRNFNDNRDIDKRYDTILGFMKEAFPSFGGIAFEQTGRMSLYCNFWEKGKKQRMAAYCMSEGHLQMLIHLAALFSETPSGCSLLLIDEPETALHPWALAVLAKAIKEAASNWEKQILIATHSPALISQFEPEDLLAVEKDDEGKNKITRASEIEDIKDLLQEYAAGSLYMAEAIAPQSKQAEGIE